MANSEGNSRAELYLAKLSNKVNYRRSHSETQTAHAELHRDGQFLALAASGSLAFLGVLLYVFGVINLAAIVFALPLLLLIVKNSIQRFRQAKMRKQDVKTNLMKKGDKRFWGRGK